MSTDASLSAETVKSALVRERRTVIRWFYLFRIVALICWTATLALLGSDIEPVPIPKAA